MLKERTALQPSPLLADPAWRENAVAAEVHACGLSTELHAESISSLIRMAHSQRIVAMPLQMLLAKVNEADDQIDSLLKDASLDFRWQLLSHASLECARSQRNAVSNLPQFSAGSDVTEWEPSFCGTENCKVRANFCATKK